LPEVAAASGLFPIGAARKIRVDERVNCDAVQKISDWNF
jgi:hypothetical protein